MLRFDLENENDIPIRKLSRRIRQCETLGEFGWRNRFARSCAGAGPPIDLATALGEEVPDLSGGRKDAPWASGGKRGSHSG